MKKVDVRKWILGLLCLLTAGTVALSYAYQSDYKEKNNPVSVGDNTSTIAEEFPSPSPINPDSNQSYAKKVSVTNLQSVPCYVRMSVQFSNHDIGTFSLSGLNTKEWVWVSVEENEKLGGYYYYQTPVSPGDTTLPLFTGVTVNSAATFPDDSLEVYVYEESVQSASQSSYQAAWSSWLRE